MTRPTSATGLPSAVSVAAPRIALVTPHTGGNLGDAAIQESALHAIRCRYPDADIVMITLSPTTTSRLHGVRSFPIGITTFLPGFEVTPERQVEGNEAAESGMARRLRTVVHGSPILLAAARRVLRVLHTTRIGSGVREIGHVARAIGVMRGASMVVISGGGQIDDYWGGPFRHPYALLKWAMIGRVMGARCVFLSVGVCALRSKWSSLFVSMALRLADYRSYRDAESKRRLDHLAFVRRDRVCPDLAFGYRAPFAGRQLHAGAHRPVVGVSPIAYLSKHRWPDEDDAIAEAYRACLLKFIAYLLGHNHEVVLFSTDPVDRRIIAEMLESPSGEGEVLGDHPFVSVPYTETLEQLAPVMQRLDVVVASRLHGVILSHVALKPVVAISYDRKVDTHMHEVGLGDYCLDIHTVDIDALLQAFGMLRRNTDAMVSRLADVTAAYRVAVDDQGMPIPNY